MNKNKILAAVLAVLVLVASIGIRASAQQATQTRLKIVGLPDITITAQAQTASVLASDPGTLTSKRAYVVRMTTVDGYPVVLLVRIQKASNGLFLDIIGEATIGELTTRVAALTITGSSHPATTRDAVDAAVLVDAAD